MAEIPWTASPDDFDELWDGSVGNDKHLGVPVVPDMLCTMFKQQFEHMRTYSELTPDAWVMPEQWGHLKRKDVQAALRENAGYVVEELYEAVGLLKNKPWKQTPVDVDYAAFCEELADVWHFFLQLHILAGLSPMEVFEDYFRKSGINKQRQQGDY